jgi:glycosyltransferase involved in cell wall biosynthesis
VRRGPGVSRGRVAVVTSGFPRLSETFAVGELLGLHRAGRLAGIFATKPGDEAVRQPGVDELLPYVTHLPRSGTGEQARSVAAAIVTAAGDGPPVTGVHGYFAHAPAAVAERAATMLGLPFTFSVHAKDARKVEPAELGRRVAAAAGVVVCNTDVQASVEAVGVPAGRVVLLPHGVDVERFRPRLAPDAGPDRPLHVLAVGRLVEKKGFAVLLRAVARLHRPWLLRVVGDGPLHAGLAALVQETGTSDRVDLLGAVGHDLLPAHYAWADVVVVPSVVDGGGDRDGLPNVLLEAMASGLPVLGTDAGAVGPTLRASGGGLVLPAGDPAPLASVLDSLARNSAVLRLMGAQGRAHAVAHHAVAECSARFVRHLEALHGRTPVPAP